MSFEQSNPVENREKEPKTIEEWIKFINPEMRTEFVDKIEKEGREDEVIPAAYCFNGEDPKYRENERMEINRESNETNKSPLDVALHEGRHTRQRDYEAKEKGFDMLNVECVRKFFEELGKEFPDSLGDFIDKIDDGPREVDAVLFSYLIENAMKDSIISKEDILGLMDMDSNELLDYLREKIHNSRKNTKI